MNDLSKVKEINVVSELAYANKHLANGWVLIAVNSISGNDKSSNSSVSTQYVLGWEGALPSKRMPQYEDEAVTSKYASQYEDTGSVEPKLAKLKPKVITITD